MEGILRFKGREYGVPFTLPGDLVQFQARGRHFRVVKVEPLEGRKWAAEPFCEHYADCGGCRGQHFPYQDQLAMKSEPVLAAMKAHYGLDVEIVPAAAIRSYRNRMDFVVDQGLLGLRPAGEFSRIVPIQNCAIQTDPANQLLQAVRTALSAAPGASFSRSETATGTLKYVTLRSGDEGVVVLTIEAGRAGDPEYVQFLRKLMALLPQVSLIQTESQHPQEVSCIPGGQALQGGLNFKARIPLTQCGQSLNFSVPYDAFFQPNPIAFGNLLEAMESFLLERLVGLNEAHVLDLFCGVGTLSVYLARRFAPRFSRFTGIDFTGSAIQMASMNLAMPGAELRFLERDLNREKDLPAAPDFVVLDPPRAGAGPVLRKYLESLSCPILYISCNPESQLSDLKSIPSYRPIKAWIVDQFPQTPHLEQAVYLEKI